MCDIFFTVKHNSIFIKVELIWFYSIITIQLVSLILEIRIMLKLLINKNIHMYVILFIIQLSHHFLIIVYSYIMIPKFEQMDRNNLFHQSILRNYLSNFFFFIFILLPKGFIKIPHEFFFKNIKLRTESNIKLNGDSVTDINDTIECTICLQTYQVGCNISIMKCNHFFHEKCIKKWLDQKLNCPNCRQII